MAKIPVTAHFNSYASGMVQFCEHFPSIANAKATFRAYLNGHYGLYLDGVGDDGKLDAVMDLYPHTPEDTDDMAHGDYPLARYAAGQRRYGEHTIRKVSI